MWYQIAQQHLVTVTDQSATVSATVDKTNYLFLSWVPSLLPRAILLQKSESINASSLIVSAINQNGLKLSGAVAQTQAPTPTVLNTCHSMTTYTAYLPLVNAPMHLLQNRWPHAITCIGSFSTFLQTGQVRVASSAGFRGPILPYTVDFPMLYPWESPLVSILLSLSNWCCDFRRERFSSLHTHKSKNWFIPSPAAILLVNPQNLPGSCNCLSSTIPASCSLERWTLIRSDERI